MKSGIIRNIPEPSVWPGPTKVGLDDAPPAAPEAPEFGSTDSAPCSRAFLNICLTNSAPSFFLGPKICCPLVSEPPA